MNSKKHGIIIILTVVLALSLLLTACGTDSGSITDTNSPTPDTSTPTGDTNTPATQTGETPPDTEPGSPADEMLENKAVTEFIEWIKNATISYDYIEFSDAPEGKRETIGSMAMSGDKVAVSLEMTVNGELYKTHIIHKDGKTYMLNNENKIYWEVPSGVEITENMLEVSAIEKTGEGTGEINGKTLPYEDYTYKGSGDTLRFFLEGSNIYGYEASRGGTKSVQIISNASGSVPESVFDIPADYTQIDMPEFYNDFYNQ